MKEINDGGPAFPCGPSGMSISYDDGRTEHQYPGSPGMSLRDWFASHASHYDTLRHKSIIEQANGFTQTPSVEECKYAYADAMLKARSANV